MYVASFVAVCLAECLVGCGSCVVVGFSEYEVDDEVGCVWVEESVVDYDVDVLFRVLHSDGCMSEEGIDFLFAWFACE